MISACKIWYLFISGIFLKWNWRDPLDIFYPTKYEENENLGLWEEHIPICESMYMKCIYMIILQFSLVSKKVSDAHSQVNRAV